MFFVFTGYGQELVILVNKEKVLLHHYRSIILLWWETPTGVAGDNDFVIIIHWYWDITWRISCEEGVWYLNDSSSNGTYVNGERVEKRCRLSGGEIIDLFVAWTVFGITFCAVIKQKEQSLETSPKLIPFFRRGQ